MKATKPKEFVGFVDKLMAAEHAPSGYTPWIIPCKKESKDPDTKISWKAPSSRLTPAEAKRRLTKQWGNVGIAGRPDDQLILVDIDDPSIENELKPTLKIRSRSRTGTHAIYWADPDDDKLPCNIPTNKGEIRSSDQYVVAPGSYVPCTKQELKDKVEAGELTEEQKQQVMEDPDRGYYTVDNNHHINTIKFEELPEVFREQYHDGGEEDEWRRENYNPEEIENNKECSALFDLSTSDLTGRGFKGRDAHPLHTSETGANWCIEGELGHCWRHLVSLNAIQYLCVESGYLSCLDAGSSHHNSNSGPSEVRDNDEAIWKAWKYAKEQKYIPEDDPIPARALCHIARKHDLCSEEKIPDRGSEELLPRKIYEEAVEIVRYSY